MRRLVAILVLVPALAWGLTAADLEQIPGVTPAWLARAQQAVAWSQGQQTPVSVDEVAAEMVSRLNAVVVQQEQAHGIDPATGEADPARLVADLQNERAAKAAAQTDAAARQAALVDAVAEVDSLRTELARVQANTTGAR